MRRFLIILAFLGSLLGAISASEEGALAFDTFRFTSGPFEVMGAQGSHGVTSLHIKAFRKSFSLTPAQLKQLHGVIVNCVQLSGEGGYRGFGGQILYLKLSMGFTSRITESKFVEISEEDGVKVRDKL